MRPDFAQELRVLFLAGIYPADRGSTPDQFLATGAGRILAAEYHFAGFRVLHLFHLCPLAHVDNIPLRLVDVNRL